MDFSLMLLLEWTHDLTQAFLVSLMKIRFVEVSRLKNKLYIASIKDIKGSPEEKLGEKFKRNKLGEKKKNTGKCCFIETILFLQ